ncbi:hypothetical protein RIF29_27120 [Crotalaria pallida]|uniref:Uncharacterized protein n=1 Tax=Crotalaria pallida TaxID=3830 RepID=A0AAN9ENH7_CROPI
MREHYGDEDEEDQEPGFKVIEKKHGDYECPEFVLNTKEQKRIFQKTRRPRKKEAREKGGREEEARVAKGKSHDDGVSGKAGGSRFNALQNQEEEEADEQRERDVEQTEEREVAVLSKHPSGKNQAEHNGQQKEDKLGTRTKETRDNKDNKKERAAGLEGETSKGKGSVTKRVDLSGCADVSVGAQAALGKGSLGGQRREYGSKNVTQSGKSKGDNKEVVDLTKVESGPPKIIKEKSDTSRLIPNTMMDTVNQQIESPDPGNGEVDMIFEDCNAIDWATPTMQSEDENQTHGNQYEDSDMEFVPDTLEAHL